VVERLGLGRGTTVVDVAAGTGKLTRQLAATGARVVAVEPLGEMRTQLEVVLPDVESVAASAEALPLPDGSADAITVGSAMHWFDLDLALPEFHRVLRPGGGLAVLGQGRDLADPMQRALQEILAPHVPDAAAFGVWRRDVAGSGLFSSLEERHASVEQLLDPEALAERVGTISYVARLPGKERTRVLAQVLELGASQPVSPFPFRYLASAAICRRRDPDYPVGR
jgi:ubiquinone/menaquinone biosynthesis C-methylase UbiE